ncbi:MAG: outer membrane lipoprotein LolB [Halioglobus sp.]|nr:outer membrane lipoprotein LolB [Halioglobus sp.]
MRTVTGTLTSWLLLALVAGCTGLAEREPTSPGWQVHRAQVAALQTWTANGKLAVRTADASESASVVWQQDKQLTHLQLSGPLGMGATTIDSDGQRLDIRRGDDHTTLDISTPDAILLNTGWDLPLTALSHWIKGLPAPDAKIQQIEVNADTALLQSLQQDDWEVSFDAYGQFQDYILPTRLQINRGTTRVKLVISRWQTGFH